MISEHRIADQAGGTYGSSEAAAGWKRSSVARAQILAPLTERMLDLAGVDVGHRVLDIAAGTGERTLLAAQRPDGPEWLYEINSDKQVSSRPKNWASSGVSSWMRAPADLPEKKPAEFPAYKGRAEFPAYVGDDQIETVLSFQPPGARALPQPRAPARRRYATADRRFAVSPRSEQREDKRPLWAVLLPPPL